MSLCVHKKWRDCKWLSETVGIIREKNDIGIYTAKQCLKRGRTQDGQWRLAGFSAHVIGIANSPEQALLNRQRYNNNNNPSFEFIN